MIISLFRSKFNIFQVTQIDSSKSYSSNSFDFQKKTFYIFKIFIGRGRLCFLRCDDNSSGLEKMGFCHPQIQKSIERLPLAAQCTNYVFKYQSFRKRVAIQPPKGQFRTKVDFLTLEKNRPVKVTLEKNRPVNSFVFLRRKNKVRNLVHFKSWTFKWTFFILQWLMLHSFFSH